MNPEFPFPVTTIRRSDDKMPGIIRDLLIPTTYGVYSVDSFGHYAHQIFALEDVVIRKQDLVTNQLLEYDVKPVDTAYYFSLALKGNWKARLHNNKHTELQEANYQVSYFKSRKRRKLKMILGPGTYEHFQIRITTKMMETLARRYNTVRWLLTYAGEGLAQQMHDLSFALSPELLVTYNNCINEIGKPKPSYKIIAGLISRMIAIYAATLYYSVHGYATDRNLPLKEQLVNYIRSKPYDAVTNEEMAKAVNESLSSFKKTCIRELGMTPGEFSLFHRLSWAAELLVEKPQLLIQDVAWETGFQDQDHFADLFKKHFNCLPSIYRQQQKP